MDAFWQAGVALEEILPSAAIVPAKVLVAPIAAVILFIAQSMLIPWKSVSTVSNAISIVAEEAILHSAAGSTAELLVAPVRAFGEPVRFWFVAQILPGYTLAVRASES